MPSTNRSSKEVVMDMLDRLLLLHCSSLRQPSYCNLHIISIGEKGGGVGSIHYRSGGLEGSGASGNGGVGGGGSSLVTASSSPSPTSSLPSAAEPPSHPVSLEVSEPLLIDL